MRRVSLNYINEVNELLKKVKEATIYQDIQTGKFIVEYFI